MYLEVFWAYLVFTCKTSYLREAVTHAVTVTVTGGFVGWFTMDKICFLT